MSEKLREVWMNQVRKSWIWMIDETRALVGCTDEETNERRYRNKYMWGISANSVNLAWFISVVTLSMRYRITGWKPCGS